MTEQLDTQGEAREALSSMVTDYSKRILSDPRMLGNIVTDLLPDLPRERSLLVTAAEADVAGDLTRHVEENHLDADTAVSLVARSLSERRAIDPAASTWVTSEYAQALGYHVQSVPAAPPPAPPQPPPADPATQTYDQYGNRQTAPAQEAAAGAAGGYSGYSQPQPPTGNGGYVPPQQGPGGQTPTGVPPQPPPPWAPATPPPKKKRNLGPILAASGAALVVVIFFAVAAVAKIPPFSSASPTPSATHPSTHPPTSHTAKPVGLALAPGVAPVIQLLPSDINTANCGKAAKADWANPGLVTALSCYDSGLSDSGDTVFAYQMDNATDYQSSWSNFASFAGFSATATSSCPPSGSATIGEVGWNDSQANDWFPAATGQIIECGTLSNSKNQNVPGYAWSFPTEDAFIVAIGSPTTSWSTLDKWWVDNSEPNASPKPTP